MADTHVERAKAALHALYDWIFAHHQHQKQPHLATRVSSYLNSFLHGKSDGALPDDSFKPPPPTYADSFGQASQALFAASLHSLKSRAQWLLHEWDPASTVDSLLWNYTPDLPTMPQRIDRGIEHLSETYDVDPKIIWLVLALPGVLLLLIVCVVMDAAGNGHGPLEEEEKVCDPSSAKVPKSRGRRAVARALKRQQAGRKDQRHIAKNNGDHGKKSFPPVEKKKFLLDL